MVIVGIVRLVQVVCLLLDPPPFIQVEAHLMPIGRELKAEKMTLNQWYIAVLRKYAHKLKLMTDCVVADAAFSVKSFVDELMGVGFNLVSRFRNDAVLHYIYQGPHSVGRGRP